MSLGALSLLTVLCIPDINHGKEPQLSKIYVAILDALERQEGSSVGIRGQIAEGGPLGYIHF